jgi:hypothetical protein
MTIDTAVFRRIVQEAKTAGRNAAVRAVADTMQETARFGTFARQYVEKCAQDRLDACSQQA